MRWIEAGHLESTRTLDYTTLLSWAMSHTVVAWDASSQGVNIHLLPTRRCWCAWEQSDHSAAGQECMVMVCTGGLSLATSALALHFFPARWLAPHTEERQSRARPGLLHPPKSCALEGFVLPGRPLGCLVPSHRGRTEPCEAGFCRALLSRVRKVKTNI